MNSLPDEILELIVGDTDVKSMAKSRLVCRRWNVLSVRLLSKTVAATGFKTRAKVESFLQLIATRIQDFPFSKYRLEDIDRENIKTLNKLFQTCSEHVKEVDTGYVKCVSPKMTQSLQTLMARIATAPRLRILTTQFEGKYFTRSVFSSLTKLCLRKVQLQSDVPPMKSLPNLQILDIECFVFTLNYKSKNMLKECCNWPFPEEYKSIREIRLRSIDLWIKFGEDSQKEILTTVLSVGKNVKIIAFKCYKSYRSLEASLINDLWLKRALTKVLGFQASNIISMCVVSPSRIFTHLESTFALNIPTLTKLRNLELDFEDSSPLEPIDEFCLPNLERVQIKYFHELNSLLHPSAVFINVKTLQLEENNKYSFWQMSSPPFPNFGEVFPNLKELEYSFTTGYRKQPNLDIISHIISSLRLEFLLKFKFHCIISDSYYTGGPGIEATRRIYQIFSGLDDVENVAENGKLAAKNNEESAYWKEIEKLRLPSLVACSELSSLELSWPISEDFVQCVLLRICPLKHLSVCLHQVSDGTLKKLKTLHGSDLKFTAK